MVRHHTIPVATVEQIDWHLRNLFSDGWKVVEEVTLDEHIARHSDGRSAIQWIDNFKGGPAVCAHEAAALRMEGRL